MQRPRNDLPTTDRQSPRRRNLGGASARSTKDRSLNIKLDADAPGGFVVHSFAGDDPVLCKDFVREKLGLDPFKANGKRRLVETYEYTDESGEALFRVCRYEPKSFPQQRRNSRGEWEWGLGDTRRVPYHLPEVLEAASLGKPIVIAEGEKAVNALTKFGVTATCSPGGAGKWRPEYAQYLAGAGDVIVPPDNDDAGEKHAADILRSIASARVVRLPELPHKGDPFDWIANGGTADDLWQLVESIEDQTEQTAATGWKKYAFTAAVLRTMEFPPVSYVVPGVIPEGLTILAGRPKIGKSWMALDLAIGIATGKPVLGGVHVEQGDVLYCCLEDNPRRLKRRVTKLLSPFSDEWPERLTLATSWRQLDEGGVDDIEAWCKDALNPRLVLLDTLAGVRPNRGGTDTLYEGDYRALGSIHRLANDRGVGAVALHHTRKMDADDPVDTISGSLGLAGAADTCLILARGPKGTTLYIRGRDIEECEKAVSFGSENCRWTLLGNAADVQWTDAKSKILAALSAAKDLMGPADIASVTGIPRNTVDVTLHRLAADGEVVQVSRGRYAHHSKEFANPVRKKDCQK